VVRDPPVASDKPIPSIGVKVNEAKDRVQFLKGNHTYGSQQSNRSPTQG